MANPLLPGAEPFTVAGGPVGVLVLHGYTGNPGSVRPLAAGLAAAGFTVSAPVLPGHGTHIDDLLATGWDDWSASVEAAYADLAGGCERVVVAGQSMGGTLAVELVVRHPEIAGLALVNPIVQRPDPALDQLVRDMVAAGELIAPSIGSDIADPDATETAYEGTPLVPLLTLFDALDALQPRLAGVACPVLLLTSAEDHVVEPVNSDHLAKSVVGPVERVALTRSYHVAILDYDGPLIVERTVEFVGRVAS